MNKTQRNALWYGGFWLLLTLWLRLCLPESMMGWERHQLFRFSAEYLTFFATTPYPVLLYLQAFFTQFYLYPLLGAAVVSGLLVLGMGAWHRLCGRYWTGAVWAALMLPLLPYYNLLWLLVWLVLLGGGLLINLRGLSTGWRLGVTAACGLLGSLLIQENIVLGLVFWSLINGLRTHAWRQGLYGLAAGLVGGGIGIGLIYWIGYPLFYSLYLGRWTLLTAHFEFATAFPINFFPCPPLIRLCLYAGCCSLLLPLAALLPQPNRLTKVICGLIVGGLMVGAGYINLRYQSEDSYRVDRLAGQGQWTEAAEAAERLFFETVRPEAIGRRLKHLKQPSMSLYQRLNITPLHARNLSEEMYIADMVKICLLADKKASSTLFTYNGSAHFPLLFGESFVYAVSSYMMACYDTDNGLYAEALHLLYDFVTSGRISTAVLEPLLWNSVVVGDYEPCRKFIRLFEQSLFHRDIARRYTAYLADTAQTAKLPEIAAARKWLSTYNHTVMAYNPDDNMYFRVLHEIDNPAVYEYALSLWMVYKNHEHILADLPKIRRYYPVLPVHIQEAVLACFPANRLNEAPMDIDPAIKARYAIFLQTYTLYQNGYTPFRKLKKGFEDTYWYHLYFNEFKPLNEDRPSGSGGTI